MVERDGSPFALMVMDMDGTLIDIEGRVSERVARAVGAAAKSLKVSIASGREAEDVGRYARQLGLTAPQISDGGANVFDLESGRSLWRAPLGRARSTRIAALVRGHGGQVFATYPGGTVRSAQEVESLDLTRLSVLDLDPAAADRLLAAAAPVAAVDAVKVFLPYNGLWAVDFTRAGVSKATAVRQICRMMEIDPARVVAIGDSYNDIPMLKFAGLGIAMGNAPPEVKAVAGYVAPTIDEDGLAAAIELLVLT